MNDKPDLSDYEKMEAAEYLRGLRRDPEASLPGHRRAVKAIQDASGGFSSQEAEMLLENLNRGGWVVIHVNSDAA